MGEPTLDEVMRQRREMCEREGHEGYDALAVEGVIDPLSFHCTRCGAMFYVQRDPEHPAEVQELRLRVADSWETFQQLARRAEDEWGDDSPAWLDQGISALEYAIQGDPGHGDGEEFVARRAEALQQHGLRLGLGPFMT